jgi:hypothetical protein
MPWLDWQFYVVTAAAGWGAWNLMRQFLPKTGPAGPACGACAAGACACAKKPQTAAGPPASPLVVLRDRRSPRDQANRAR